MDENKENNFDLVHKKTTKVLVEAIKGSKVKKICYISIVGANKESKNKESDQSFILSSSSIRHKNWVSCISYMIS